jgi:hypothetical protein
MTSDDGQEELPYRVVDAHNQGWLNTSNDADGHYQADYGWRRDLPNRPLADLDRDRGPLRPVLPITDDDRARLTDVFLRAGRKTVASIAAALEEVFHRIREERGGLRSSDSYEYAMRTLTAGREGSWESELLKDLVLFGNGLNLMPPRRGADNTIEARRAAGPSARVDVAARHDLTAVFTRWVTDPDRYTEVAETLALVVSGFADDSPAGWGLVADRWLQPGGLAHKDFRNCYRLLYSQSKHFNPDLL